MAACAANKALRKEDSDARVAAFVRERRQSSGGGLDHVQPLILEIGAQRGNERVRAGRVVEGHGDLRPEHVWLGEPPAIIDCLEFSAELRTLDTADELAFLALECERLGAPQLGRALLDAFAEFTGDVPAPALVDFYQAFRACVRANIAIRHLREARYRDDPKWPRRAREYLALARQKVLSSRT